MYFLKIKKRESGAQRRVRKKERKKSAKEGALSMDNFRKFEEFLLGEQRI